MKKFYLLSLFVLAPALCSAQGAFGQLVPGGRAASVADIPAAASAPAPEADPGLVVRLTQEDMRDAAKLAQVSTDMFESYMSESKLFRPLEKVVARIKYKQVLGWTVPFLQSHVKGMELSLREETVGGKKRMVVLSSMDYNGHKVEFLRFRSGNDSATAVRIDGKMEQGQDGTEKMFFTGDQGNFSRFVEWFEGRLGKPGRPKEPLPADAGGNR